MLTEPNIQSFIKRCQRLSDRDNKEYCVLETTIGASRSKDYRIFPANIRVNLDADEKIVFSTEESVESHVDAVVLKKELEENELVNVPKPVDYSSVSHSIEEVHVEQKEITGDTIREEEKSCAGMVSLFSDD